MRKEPLQTVRIGIYGASGSGKSYKAKQLIENCNRLIVFDVMSEYYHQKGFVAARNMAELKKHLGKNWNKGFKIAYIPSFQGDIPKELCEVSDFLYMAQADFQKNNLFLTFLVEELSMSYPASGKNAQGFTNLACRGRHRGIHLIGISQRLAKTNTDFRGNCTSLYIFRPADYIDVDIWARVLGPQYRGRLETMQYFDYLYLKNGRVLPKHILEKK